MNHLQKKRLPIRNIGVLPMNESYTIGELSYNEDFGCNCQNCGRLIKNIVEIKNSKGIKFYVGMDCADTLESFEISNYFEYQDKKKKIRNLLAGISKVSKVVNTGKYTILFDYDMGLYVYDAIRTEWSSNSILNNRQIYLSKDFINIIIKKYNVLYIRESEKMKNYWIEKGIIFN